MVKICVCAIALFAAASAARAEPIAPERIVDAVTGDWNKDGRQDLAMLVAPPEKGDMIGIYIYVRDADHSLLKLVAAAPEKIWGNFSLDGMFGQDPTITALPNGSIAVRSQNSSIGRDRWDQTLTLASRNGDFVVAGYTYNYYDTLDLNNTGTCDYNVLTGKIKRDGKPLSANPLFVTIQDWNDEMGRKACKTP